MKPAARTYAAIPAIAMLALAPLAVAPAAFAAETDISVVYSTQNDANASIDGSSTVHGRVGQTRDDMRVTYTIQSDTVRYPLPVINYTGTFTESSDATYTFRFDCDNTVTGSDCELYATQVAAMNAAATALDGRSIETFTADVTPIVMTFGGDVPPGIRGTVAVSVNSAVPGTGQLEFYLQEGDQPGAERLSPTAVTPLSITQPQLAATSPDSFCAVGLVEYTEGDTKYTPTGFGRDGFDVQVSATDDGILPDDATPVGSEASLIRFSISGGPSGLTESELESELLASPAGTYEIEAVYTAPDGVPATEVAAAITVLGADDPACWSASTITDPVDPEEPTDPEDPVKPDEPTQPTGVTQLAKTGAIDADHAFALAAAGLLGGALLLGAGLRRRFGA